MAARKSAAVPPAARLTLSEWIEQDDGDTPYLTQPVCDDKTQQLHALIITPGADVGEKLQPPPGLLLAPLG